MTQGKQVRKSPDANPVFCGVTATHNNPVFDNFTTNAGSKGHVVLPVSSAFTAQETARLWSASWTKTSAMRSACRTRAYSMRGIICDSASNENANSACLGF
jgi:hypothetical protein